jgi:hypothetical protein
MGNMLRALILETRSRNQQPLPADLEDFIDTALVACTKQAINATIHSTTKESPGAFVFQCSMILPIQSFANWELARKSHSEMTGTYSMRIIAVILLIGSLVWKS